MTRPRHIPGSVITLTVKRRSGKPPLSVYLAARLGVVESWALDLLASGAVKLDGASAGPATCINLSFGTHAIEVAFPEAWPRHMAPVPLPLSILYEDAVMVALDKPPGIVVHPARGHLDNRTLQNGVRHRYRGLLHLDSTTIGPTHRLDKDTSGVCLFSLTRSAYIELTRQFAKGEVCKEYLAVVDGKPEWSELVCEQDIVPDPGRRGLVKAAADGEAGKRSVTRFAVIARGNGAALVRAVPKTGRPHQIRAHLASLGFPIIGDGDYHPCPDAHGFARQALHADFLGVRHPDSGLYICIRSPLPEDMRGLIEKTGLSPGMDSHAGRG